MLEREQAFSVLQMLADDGTLRGAENKFLINLRIVETVSRRVLPAASEVKAFGTSPVDRTQAHRTWLTARVDFTPGELKSAQFPACAANSNYFRVRSRVIVARNGVYSSGDEAFLFHDQRAKGSTPLGPNVFDGQIDGLPHPVPWIVRHVV